MTTTVTRGSAVAGLALVFLTWAVFWPVRGFDFTDWDDRRMLADNADYRPARLENFAHYWTGPHLQMYAPLSYSVWEGIAAWDQWRTGAAELRPAPFHLANLIAHTLAVLCVFGLLRQLLGGDTGAFPGACVFAVHPLQVEPVAWVGSFYTVLSGMFVCAALWMYVLHVRSEARGRRAAWFAGSCAALGLALFAKPSAIVAPLMAATIEAFVLRRRLRLAWRPVIAWAALVVPFVLVGRSVQGPSPAGAAPLWLRPVVALDALGFYLTKLFVPIGLTIDYGRRPDRVPHLPTVWLTCAFALTAIVLAAILWREGKTFFAAGLAILVAALLPVLGVVPFAFQFFSTVADRYMYLGMVGAALAASVWVKAARARVVRALATVILIALVFRSSARVQDWRDTFTLADAAIRANGGALAGHRLLAFALARADHLNEAAESYERALAFQPADTETRYNYANLLVRMDRPAEAIAHYERAVREDTDAYAYRRNLGAALMLAGRTDDALELWRRRVESAPGDARARVAYAGLLRLHGDLDGAMREVEAALRQSPGLPEAEAELRRIGDARLAATRPS